MVAKIQAVDIAVANTPQNLAQVAAGKEELFSIHCCNRTANPVTVKLGVSATTAVFETAKMYWFDFTVAANGFEGIQKIILPAASFLVVEASATGVNFMANSVEE